MSELGPVAWPPTPIKTERLMLREPEARDRAAIIELFTSPEVGTFIGGPRSRDEFERALPEAPERRPGLFVVDLDGAMIGVVTLDRRDAERPGHVRPEGGEVELGYMFLPQAWGFGYATEACAAALDWVAGALPGEPVVLNTQTANVRSVRLISCQAAWRIHAATDGSSASEPLDLGRSVGVRYADNQAPRLRELAPQTSQRRKQWSRNVLTVAPHCGRHGITGRGAIGAVDPDCGSRALRADRRNAQRAVQDAQRINDMRAVVSPVVARAPVRRLPRLSL